MTLPKRTVAIIAFAAGIILAGATAYGVSDSLRTASSDSSGGGSNGSGGSVGNSGQIIDYGTN